LAVRADVRDPKQVQAAVKQTIEKYGRIDFVINGNCLKRTFYQSIYKDHWLSGAAGNFLAPISGLSENGFRTVIEIDTVGLPLCSVLLILIAEFYSSMSLGHIILSKPLYPT
jgi:peroxisomal 2,4-dienoyl-CoA reductase